MARGLSRSGRTVQERKQAGHRAYLKIGKAVLFQWTTAQRHLNERFQVLHTAARATTHQRILRAMGHTAGPAKTQGFSSDH